MARRVKKEPQREIAPPPARAKFAPGLAANKKAAKAMVVHHVQIWL